MLDVADIHELRVAAQSVYVDDLLRRWIVSLVRSTRELESVAIGASVRGSLALESAARAWALLQERSYVVPADVELLFTPVVDAPHRLPAELPRRGAPVRLARRGRAAAGGVPGGRAPAGTVGDGALAVSAVEQIFPLVPRRPLLGVSYAAMRSARRGVGSDIAGSRAYRPGDNVDTIDWAASARLSSATGLDEFIVRERFADEAPWVVVLADRRPSMALYGDPFPWLRKFDALEQAVDIVLRSALAARSLPAYVDLADEEVYWRAPRAKRDLWAGHEQRAFTAAEETIARGLEELAIHRPALPLGTFVFVLSDFLAPPPRESWLEAVERGWDVIPVVIQDPTLGAELPRRQRDRGSVRRRQRSRDDAGAAQPPGGERPSRDE